ncbi:hypothetical protein BH23BAC1_BH23BAC1_29010 [soil metagenome]
MLEKVNICGKISSIFLSIVLISLIFIIYISYSLTKGSLEKSLIENLTISSSSQVLRIKDYRTRLEERTEFLKEQEIIKEIVFNKNFLNEKNKYTNELIQKFASLFHSKLGFDEVTLFNNENISLINFGHYDSEKKEENSEINDHSFLFSASQKFSFTFSSDLRHLLVGAPLFDQYGTKIGFLVGKQVSQLLFQMLSESPETDYIHQFLILRNSFNNPVVKKIDAQSDSTEEHNLEFPANPKFSEALINASLNPGISYGGEDEDKIIFFTKPVPDTDWNLVAKTDQVKYYAALNQLRFKFIIAGFTTFIIGLVLIIIFKKSFSKSLNKLNESVQLLGLGVLPEKMGKYSNDDLGKISEGIDKLVQGLRSTADFARQLGAGHFDSDYKPLSEKDTLGTALLTMRDSIQQSENKDKERNWIVTGLAETGEILRSHNNLVALGDAVTAYLSHKIKAIQCAIYVVNEGVEDEATIDMVSSYAYNKKKFLNAKFKFAQGLVGQSAIEQDILLRTEIPDNYMSITSGLLGDQKPKCILVVPLITNDKVYGVLEFAGFNKFGESQIKFVQEISYIIARTIFNIKVNEQTKNLLDESQKLSDELREQQEYLRENAEEMRATQEELKHSNLKLEEQVSEVERSQKRMQLLLENASEVITIYEKDGVIRYISPSVQKILGYNPKELIGIKDIIHVSNESVELYKGMFLNLVNNPREKVNIQLKYKKKTGEDVWLELTGTNLLSDPAVHGLIVNSRDITERRRAEQEQRMRTQMQALSENSPDLITRFNQQGVCFYINPVIEQYTLKNPDYFINKSIEEVELPPDLIHQWLKIINEVNEQQEKVSTEMSFPSEMGDRVMQVNAIPEYNENNNLESVLVVSHDITERKAIELEIQSKNKKITESINYAKRIQGAILPNNHLITKIFPESFIYYKAKDVVSGDFPWFIQVGDCYYIAAVDCTGHGVPGAFISLIGYFLLNDIVRSRRISDTGVILDELDEAVTRTLRQDLVENSAKDGMDISLCKINPEKGVLEYAGAHRPLYLISKGELSEIKGNKFAIGGGVYKNQTNFTNNKVKITKGDSMFLCSDGFPDQFGGPENRKFGPHRLRDLLAKNHHLKMEQFQEMATNEWENWKGNNKQTDDVLLIGIKF